MFPESSLLSFIFQVGERQRVLVTEESFDSNYYVAHNPFYEQVQLNKQNNIFSFCLCFLRVSATQCAEKARKERRNIFQEKCDHLELFMRYFISGFTENLSEIVFRNPPWLYEYSA